ncbi:MAG: 3-dehydroquinate synthase [Planctomycetota bacterium]
MPASLQRVDVELDQRSYPIIVSSGQIDKIAGHVVAAIPDLTHAVLIHDEAVSWLANDLAKQLENLDKPVRVSSIDVASGEPSKSIDVFDQILRRMLDEKTDRKSIVIAVGGGVAGDLAGFVAASFARGLRFIQIPTTLLAMVDSSVGGKTGINLPGAKNMVGAFWQPRLVAIDTETMKTLDERSYQSGIAEVIKYGVIEDAEFFAWLEKNAEPIVERDSEAVRHAICVSCQCKANVVRDDERETSGRRAILNYGHTFAHAIEATAGYGSLLHGEAVAIGMNMAAHLAIDLGLCDASLIDRQIKLIERCQLPTTWTDANATEMLPVMNKDKKVEHGKLKFILPTRVGEVRLVGDVDSSAVEKAIEACR